MGLDNLAAVLGHPREMIVTFQLIPVICYLIPDLSFCPGSLEVPTGAGDWRLWRLEAAGPGWDKDRHCSLPTQGASGREPELAFQCALGSLLLGVGVAEQGWDPPPHPADVGPASGIERPQGWRGSSESCLQGQRTVEG